MSCRIVTNVIPFSSLSAAFSSLEFGEIPKLQRSPHGGERHGRDSRVFKGSLARARLSRQGG